VRRAYFNELNSDTRILRPKRPSSILQLHIPPHKDPPKRHLIPLGTFRRIVRQHCSAIGLSGAGAIIAQLHETPLAGFPARPPFWHGVAVAWVGFAGWGEEAYEFLEEVDHAWEAGADDADAWFDGGPHGGEGVVPCWVG
jgi:hypothetical protein